jgi:hypothetical protein
VEVQKIGRAVVAVHRVQEVDVVVACRWSQISTSSILHSQLGKNVKRRRRRHAMIARHGSIVPKFVVARWEWA